MAYSRLRRNTSARKALMRDLVTDLIIHERLITTEAKAKALSREFDQVVTLAKAGKLPDIRQAATVVRNEAVNDKTNALQKLFREIGKRYEKRSSGFTRIIKTVPRRGDSAPMAIIELV
jgi:large subunit ribosomal protein L17